MIGSKVAIFSESVCPPARTRAAEPDVRGYEDIGTLVEVRAEWLKSL